jgi:hypothetical protein
MHCRFRQRSVPAAAARGPHACSRLLQMLGVSLLLWRTQGGPKSAASQLMRAASGVLLAPPPNNQSWLGANLPVLLMYMPAHTFFAMWVLR